MVLPILFASICLVSIKVHAKEKIEKKVHEIKSSMNLIERELSIQAKKKKVKKSASSDFAIYLDGIILPKKDLKQLSPNMIESVQFIKDKEGLKKYGIEGKNGVVLITSKKGNKSNLQNKEELSTEIIDSKQEGTTIFMAPKIQKDLDTSRNNDPIYYTTDKPAEFPGGSSGWTAYLTKHLNPTIPLKNGAPVGKYKVLLNFVVKSNGGVSNIEVISDPGYGTAAEAIRMIEKGPKWIPAEQNGMKVNYLMKQSFVFVVSND